MAEPLRLRSRRHAPPSSIGGWVSSSKALGIAPFESLLERDAQTLICADPRIKCYAVQCHRLKYWTYEGSTACRREYIPDFVIETAEGQHVVVEVKARALAQMSSWIRLEREIRLAYREDHGVSFLVLTEAEIRRQPYLLNAQLLLAHRGALEPALELAVREELESEIVPLSLHVLAARLRHLGITYEQTFTAVMRCVLAGKVEVEVEREISAETKVWKHQ